MSRRALSLIFLALVLAVSCGPETKSPAVVLQFDQSVSEEHRKLIEGDLELLTTIKFAGDTENSDIVGIPSFTGENVSIWLQDRAKFVVGEDFASEVVAVNNIERMHEASTYKVLMLNVGAGLYKIYRNRAKPMQVRIADQNVVITSPRIGVFRIGEGHFDPLTEEFLHTLSSIANGVFRLGTLFHEARHSDGNGDSLAFSHIACPDGDYKGKLACDKWTNGPYSVGAEMVKRLYQACTGGKCSTADRVAILMEIADSRYRLRGTERGDATPVKVGP